MDLNYLDSAKKQFQYYKMLGEKAIAQVPDNKLAWQFNEESNSIVVIVKHLSGNMLSRWTDFLHSDGEKESRNRDGEFEEQEITRDALLALWDAGWACLLGTLDSLKEEDLDRTIYIRNMGHTVLEAINRQLAHYPYHVGQIVFLAKMTAQETWQSLSIPRGKSTNYNADKFSKPKRNEHFTDEYLKKE